MKVLERQFGHAAAFSLVYIAEAHASDQWFVIRLFTYQNLEVHIHILITPILIFTFLFDIILT